MFAPRASNAFVCIRCEFSLSRPRLPVFARRHSHPHFSASARYRNEEPETSQIQTSKPQRRLSAHPLVRIRRRKGKTIRETTAPLGVKTLGDEAKIIVLEEVGDPAHEDEIITPEIIPTPQDSPNILASLEQESRPLTPEEITKQLDSLRPNTHAEPDEPHYVNQATFVRLAKTLLRGFTGPQLSHYYSVAKGVQRENVQKEVLYGLKGSTGTTKRPIERTDWHPGTTQINRRLPGLDVTHRPRRKPVSKQLLVDQILRDVWKLMLLEEIEAPGEIELSLKPWQLTLLSSGAEPTPLDKIGRDRKAKLEIYWPHNALRITADKNTAEYAADDVERLLQGTELKRFDLRPWVPYLDERTVVPKKLSDIFTQTSLQTVATMTGANVHVVKGDALLIRGLSRTAVEDAERSLIKMLPLKSSSSYSVDTSIRDAVKDSSYLLPVDFEKSTLDILSRERHLARWTLPLRRPADDTLGTEQHANAGLKNTQTGDTTQSQGLGPVQARVLEMIQQSRESTLKTSPENGSKREPSNWRTRPDETLSAEFGQVLVPFNGGHVESSTDDPLAISSMASFLHTLPGLSKLFTRNSFKQVYHSKAPALEYDFVPAPIQQDFPEGQQYPSLHVRFRHDLSGKPRLKKLTLGFGESVHDILLPDKAVDIRFKRSVRLPLQLPPEDENVRDFAQAIFANIRSGERLTAPSLTLNIPTWTVPSLADSGKTGTRTVQYIFAGIRFRQSIVGDLLGARVTYSTVQSGKLGRRGGSLSAYHASDGRENSDDQGKLKEFINNCFAIADRITEAAANDVPMSDMVKPRDENSSRKLRRKTLQAASTEISTEKTREMENMAGTTNVTNATTSQYGEENIQLTNLHTPSDIKVVEQNCGQVNPISNNPELMSPVNISDPDIEDWEVEESQERSLNASSSPSSSEAFLRTSESPFSPAKGYADSSMEGERQLLKSSS